MGWLGSGAIPKDMRQTQRFDFRIERRVQDSESGAIREMRIKPPSVRNPRRTLTAHSARLAIADSMSCRRIWQSSSEMSSLQPRENEGLWRFLHFQAFPPSITRNRLRRSGAVVTGDRLRGQRGVQQVANRPDTIRDAERHGWRAAQALMHAAQIVVRDVQRHGRAVRVQLL